jgi:hypothetical protein
LFLIKTKNRQKLYLPNNEKSVVLKKEASGMYKSGSWALNTKSNYQLSNGNAVVYAAAVIQENKVIGDDWKGEVAAPVDNDTVNR